MTKTMMEVIKVTLGNRKHEISSYLRLNLHGESRKLMEAEIALIEQALEELEKDL